MKNLDASLFFFSFFLFFLRLCCWDELCDGRDIPVEGKMFFHLAIGSVYESEGSDDLALAEYLEAMRFEYDLESDHPDRYVVSFAFWILYLISSIASPRLLLVCTCSRVERWCTA